MASFDIRAVAAARYVSRISIVNNWKPAKGAPTIRGQSTYNHLDYTPAYKFCQGKERGVKMGKPNLIRSELIALGISNKQMVRILSEEYGIKVTDQAVGSAMSGYGQRPYHERIRHACWDYISKHKRTN